MARNEPKPVPQPDETGAEARAIVTGAAGAIGAEITRHLLGRGYVVGLIDRDEDELAAVTASLGAGPHGLTSEVADVTDPAAMQDAMARLTTTLGGLDRLVVNAGVMSRVDLPDLDLDEFRRVIDVNVFGAFTTIRYALPQLRRGVDPAVVTLSSAAGLNARSVTGPAYRVSKAAVISLSRVLAVELSSDGVRVNCVAPGGVDGGMAEAFSADELSAMRGSAIGGRLASPGDVAWVVGFLLDPASGYITGEVVRVAGGAGI